MGSPMYDPFHKGYRLFIGGLNPKATKYDIEQEFENYGKVTDVWVARSPPGFSFLIYKHASDAEYAVSKMNDRKFMGERIKVEHARNPSNPKLQRGGRAASSERRRSVSRDRRRSRSGGRNDRRGSPRNRHRDRSSEDGRSRRRKSRSTKRGRSRSVSGKRYRSRSPRKHSRSRSIDRSRSRSGRRNNGKKVTRRASSSSPRKEVRRSPSVKRHTSSRSASPKKEKFLDTFKRDSDSEHEGARKSSSRSIKARSKSRDSSKSSGVARSKSSSLARSVEGGSGAVTNGNRCRSTSACGEEI